MGSNIVKDPHNTFLVDYDQPEPDHQPERPSTVQPEHMDITLEALEGDAHSAGGFEAMSVVPTENAEAFSADENRVEKIGPIFRRIKISECCEKIEQTIDYRQLKTKDISFAELYRKLPVNQERNARKICPKIVFLSLLHLCNKRHVFLQNTESMGLVVKNVPDEVRIV
jgi:hypothetical protein